MRLKNLFGAVLLLLVCWPGVPVVAQEVREAAQLPPRLLNPEITIDELKLRLVPLTKDELTALAAEWSSIVQDKTREVMDAQLAISESEGPAEEQARQRLVRLVKERNALFDKFDTIIDSLESKGGDQGRIAEYRAYRDSILFEEKYLTDLPTLIARAWSWLTDENGGIALAINAAIIVASLLGLLVLARLSRRVARRWIGQIPNLSKLLETFLVTVIYWLVIAIGLMIVLAALGIDISPVFIVLAGAIFALTFAFQDTLRNIASGLMIMINRPFDEGDRIEFGGVEGTVRAMNVFATTVATSDNQMMSIPNTQVWGNIITNVNASPTRRVDLVFGISYEDSIADALQLIEEIVRSHPSVLRIPEPVIKVNELADSAVKLVCRPWVKSDDHDAVRWDLTRQVKEAFDKAGISIPYPQREIHMRTVAKETTELGE